MLYLTKEKYQEITAYNMGKHWKSWEVRWKYHEEAIKMAKSLDIKDPKKVLEMGTMGVSIVENSDDIDYNDRWNFKDFNPTYYHDAKILPWPIKDKQYDLFIALRVYQHLVPVQRECFLEAKRISKNIIIAVPKSYGRHNGRGITLNEFITWNDNKKPNEIFDFSKLVIYLWRI